MDFAFQIRPRAAVNPGVAIRSSGTFGANGQLIVIRRKGNDNVFPRKAINRKVVVLARRVPIGQIPIGFAGKGLRGHDDTNGEEAIVRHVEYIARALADLIHRSDGRELPVANVTIVIGAVRRLVGGCHDGAGWVSNLEQQWRIFIHFHTVNKNLLWHTVQKFQVPPESTRQSNNVSICRDREPQITSKTSPLVLDVSQGGTWIGRAFTISAGALTHL
mmetsp:Transcript_22198/g.61689  ORF Transcript_22198/g.61689 Transcript_22198/m.61689 type:complete len:218 (+) Transcript_22198:146-799(+)